MKIKFPDNLKPGEIIVHNGMKNVIQYVKDNLKIEISESDHSDYYSSWRKLDIKVYLPDPKTKEMVLVGEDEETVETGRTNTWL